ncbi:MAG: hypothetical protein AB7Q81_09755 [Gammaproteobacteria bacterium]
MDDGMHHALDGDEAVCPFAAAESDAALQPRDVLVLPLHRRMVSQYVERDDGVTELCLYYDDKEISFDEPELFAFGEGFARRAQFVAVEATRWGAGYAWPRVRALLEELIEAGVLERADGAALRRRPGGSRPNPLPAAPATTVRGWQDCAAITRELTGRELPLAYLECVVPVFRVAHTALDDESRQVGEANVFPPALRVETPTEWRTCPYQGTRFFNERPMNITALKGMRACWPQMMTALARIRAAYLQRFAGAGAPWTVGDVERLATLVLAVPTYALVRATAPGPVARLHPALSSLFRVTDGLRMVMHQMLFIPIGEPTRAPDAAVSAADIHAYAERNYSFHSEHGVCAGPRAMIDEFLAVIVDGRVIPSVTDAPLDAAVAAALDDLDAAFDYAMHGLRLYGTVFALWPAMARAYANLRDVLDGWPTDAASPALVAFRDGLAADLERLERESYLAREDWRTERETVYIDMIEQCSRGLRGGVAMAASASSPALRNDDAWRHDLRMRIDWRCARWPGEAAAAVHAFADTVIAFIDRAQAVVGGAELIQADINALLGRDPAPRALEAADLDLHNALQGEVRRRLPFLPSALEDLLDIRLVITADEIRIDNREPSGDAALAAPRRIRTASS